MRLFQFFTFHLTLAATQPHQARPWVLFFSNMAAAGKKPPSVRKREDPCDEGGCRGMTRARWHVTEIKMALDLGCVPPEVSSRLRI